MAQLGEMLKVEREARGLTLGNVEEAICIRRHLLESLENNQFDSFPSPVIARGLIRNYAKYLNIDPIEALTLYDGHGITPIKGQRLTKNGIVFMNLSMSPRPFLTWDLIIGVLLFILVVTGTTYFVSNFILLKPGVTTVPTVPTPVVFGLGDTAALLLPTITPPPTNTPTPLPATDTPTPVVYRGVTVELLIKQPSWIQISIDGSKDFEGVLQVGESRIWTGKQQVAIRAGNAGGVEVIVNGINRGTMGAEGKVADQVWEKVDSSTLPTPTYTPTPDAVLPLQSAPSN